MRNAIAFSANFSRQSGVRNVCKSGIAKQPDEPVRSGSRKAENATFMWRRPPPHSRLPAARRRKTNDRGASGARGGMPEAPLLPPELFLLFAEAGPAVCELNLTSLHSGNRCHRLVFFWLSNFTIASCLAFSHLVLLDFRLIFGCSFQYSGIAVRCLTQQKRNVPPRRQERPSRGVAELNRLMRGATADSALRIC